MSGVELRYRTLTGRWWGVALTTGAVGALVATLLALVNGASASDALAQAALQAVVACVLGAVLPTVFGSFPGAATLSANRHPPRW